MNRRRIRRFAIGIAALASALLAVTIGVASDLRVLLIGPSVTHPTMVRVKQELTLLGLDVEVMVGDRASDLATAAREHGAAAVARVEDAPPEIVLWVDGAHSGGSAQTTRVSESIQGQAEPGLLALRSVELLRGRLIPVPIVAPDAPTGATSAAPTAIPTAAATPIASSAPTVTASVPPEGSAAPRSANPLRASHGSLHIGPAMLASPGGLPVAAVLRLGGGYRIAAPIELDARAMIPLMGSTVSAAEGEVDVRVLALAAGASFHFFRPESAISAHAGAGIGFAGLFYEGRAVSPWVAASGSRWTALPYLDVGAGYRFTQVLGVRADLLGALARPEPTLRIAGEPVATFGTPLFLASLALEVHP